MPLLSPILDAFLNDNQSPEQLADTHKITVREALDLLLSPDAIQVCARLAAVERLRQSVLVARARSNAFATLDYLTLSDRHSMHSDCDLRRRASEAILKLSAPSNPPRRAPSTPPPEALPDLTSLRAARIASQQDRDAQPDRADPFGIRPIHTSAAAPAHPSPLFDKLSQRKTFRQPSSPSPNPAQTAAETASRMKSPSCAPDFSRIPCRCTSSDDG